MGALELFPPDRVEAMKTVCAARDEILAAIEGLPDEAFDARLPGKWSIKEIVAHLASRDWLFVRGLRLILTGAPLPWPHPGWHPTQADLDRWNSEQVAFRAGWPVRRVLHELGEARGAWYGLLLALPDELFRDTRVQEWNARRARHDRMHLPGIQERVRLYRLRSAAERGG